MIEDDLDNISLYYGRGMDFMHVQDYESALKDMDRVIELNPNSLLGHFARAIIRTKQLEYNYQLSGESAFSDNRKTGISLPESIAGVTKLPEISVKSVHYEEILREDRKSVV